MDKETFEQKIQELGSLETAEDMRAGLAELQTNLTEMFDANANLTEQIEADKKEMEGLRQANQKLFTMIGVNKTDQQQTEDSTGLKQETKERLKFEDLYNNNGDFI